AARHAGRAAVTAADRPRPRCTTDVFSHRTREGAAVKTYRSRTSVGLLVMAPALLAGPTFAAPPAPAPPPPGPPPPGPPPRRAPRGRRRRPPRGRGRLPRRRPGGPAPGRCGAWGSESD